MTTKQKLYKQMTIVRIMDNKKTYKPFMGANMFGKTYIVLHSQELEGFTKLVLLDYSLKNFTLAKFAFSEKDLDELGKLETGDLMNMRGE